MKFRITHVLCLVSFGIVMISGGQVDKTNTNSLSRSGTPNKDTIVVVVNDKSWSINELNQIVLQHLHEKSGMPKGLAVETIINIYPRDKNTMCEFHYLQGFGKPFWQVKMGFDAAIQSVEKHKMLEKEQ